VIVVSIFIFEDDIVQAQYMREIVEDICQANEIAFDFIDVTSRSDEILERIPQTLRTPIYFLDIEIKGEERKGLSVAQDIRKVDQSGIIVFVTTHSKFAPISYQYMVSALTFIDKGLDYDERYQMIEQCLFHYETINENTVMTDDFVLTNKHTTVRVPFREVEYVMTAESHRLVLVTDKRMIRFYGSLKEVEDIDERLIRCHRSYVVNREHVKTYDTSERMLVLKSGKHIPVSRRLVRTIKQLIKGEQ